MTRRAAATVAGLMLLLIVTLPGTGCRSRPEGGPTETRAAREPEEITAPEAGLVTLYFPGSGGRLYPESRSVPPELAPEDRLTWLVEELLRGPSDEALAPVLPAEVLLAGIFRTGENVAFVDLRAPAELGRLPWGSQQELLSVFSLVNSILLNESELEGVVLLWNGRQQTTFAGHVDTTAPLRVRRDMLAAERAG